MSAVGIKNRGAQTSGVMGVFLSRLRAWRLVHNWTQADMARLAGLSRATYENLEGGRANLSLNSLISVLAVLGFEANFATLLPAPPAELELPCKPSRRRARRRRARTTGEIPDRVEIRCALD